MKKYLFLLLPLFLLACNHEEKEPRPNIVLFFADDLGYGDLGIYGHPTIRTPHLDALATEGVKFTNFYTGSPACTASRYALLTGRYPAHSGFGWVLNPDSSRGIHPGEITLAEGLKKMGYATAIFGKWHLGTTRKEYLPLQNGFDEYLGLPYSNDMIPPKWPDIPLMTGNDTLELNPDQTQLTRRYTERAISFIEKNKSGPFFCYLPFAMPHVPLHPGETFAGKSTRGLYGDVIEEIDWSVGAVLKALRKNGLSENTLIFFTSDNGPWIIKDEKGGSSGLLRDGKGSTWEGGMRVPGIAFMEGKTANNKVVQSPASTLDLYTSFLKMGGYEFSEAHHFNGRDIRPLFFDQTNETAPHAYFFYGSNLLHAVRKGPWKLHVRTSSQTGKDYFNGKLPLLFNLNTDPSEQYDVAGRHPGIVKELIQEIDNQNSFVKSHTNFYQLDREKDKLTHLAFGKVAELRNNPTRNPDQALALTDGLSEAPDAFQQLPGWQGNDFETVLDLGGRTEVESIKIGFIQNPRSWIFLPADITFYRSTDGKQFTEVKHFKIEPPKSNTQTQTSYFAQNNLSIKTRYIKIKATNRPCPEWHTGQGNKCWLFADEVVVD
ncbi:MAG: sulfatase-like hydrolase/transferase [Bacteroidota bacterium]